MSKDFIEKNSTEDEFRNKGVVGIYLLAMKAGSDNFRQSAILDIIELLKGKGVEVVIYEPTLDEDVFMDCRVMHELEEFKSTCDVIVANRKAAELDDVKEKLYTRDIFLSD